jgi:DNA-binding transcriptional MerR regulator
MDENAVEGLPERPFYKIGEVAQFLGVKPYILRYWESEFKALVPHQASSGRHRKYRKEDVALLYQIKRLLYDEMYTIPGARQRLQELQRSGVLPTPPPSEDFGEDPLEGAEVAALEQQLEELQVRLEAARKDRQEALETARVASAALKEVEAAHAAARAEAARLQAALDAQGEPLRDELEALRAQAARHEAELEALRHERDRLQAALASPPPEPLLAAPPPAPLAAPDDDGWSVGADQAALLVAQQQAHDLQNKLRYQLSHKQRLLRQLRAQVAELMAATRRAQEAP